MKKQQIRFRRTADNVQIAYASVGHGPPLIKAANWLSHLEHDLHSPVWRHMVSELSSQHTLVRYDERGCGLSDWNIGEMSFEAWVSDLEAVVEASGAKRFPLLGISQGAPIAVAYAARHPERVSHLILHGGFARGRLKRGLGPEFHEEANTMVKLAELGWGKENPAFRQFFTSQMIPGGTSEQHRWFNELARISATPANAGRFMRAFNEIDVVAELPLVQCPTLVLHATRDARVPFSEGRLMAGLIPDARFVPLDSENHLLLEDEPAWRSWVEEFRAFLPRPNGPQDVLDRLSRREMQVLRLMASGCDNSQISAHLGLEGKTVRNHVTHIYAKLEVEHRAQAIILARDAGLAG
jgi:pimeloyl-ACP methyl ester carboxylesterase/DNA-binding CsgD family transcriptional regulator